MPGEPTKQQLMFQAICDCFGYEPKLLTATEKTRVGKVAKELVAAQADRGLLQYAAQAWDRLWRYQDVPLFTEMALVAHWSKIRPLCERAAHAAHVRRVEKEFDVGVEVELMPPAEVGALVDDLLASWNARDLDKEGGGDEEKEDRTKPGSRAG